jgi:hypothetical protein
MDLDLRICAKENGDLERSVELMTGLKGFPGFRCCSIQEFEVLGTSFLNVRLMDRFLLSAPSCDESIGDGGGARDGIGGVGK